MKTLELKKNIFWTGIQDPELKVFDIIMETEFGTSYNSYLVKGSAKTALFETAKYKFMDEYLDKLKSLVKIEDIDYIVVDHTEPDHAGSAAELLNMNPNIEIVGSSSAINFMKEIVNKPFKSIVVKDGDEMDLGDKTLRFIMAPNLHWPDSIYTYVVEDKVLMTCDSFGCHYSLPEVLISKLKDWKGYDRALKYYYDMIMGPFKSFMIKACNKIEHLDIEMVCPGHGPVLDENPQRAINMFHDWSVVTNPNKKKTVVIPYVSAYGYTKEILEAIEVGILKAGDVDVKSYDLVGSDMSEVLEQVSWADGVLLGSPTILGDGLKPIFDMTSSMISTIHGGKIASAFGSYGWSGEAVPNLMIRLKQLKMKLYGEGFRIKFKPSEEQMQDAIDFGYGFGLSVLSGKIVDAEEKAEKEGLQVDVKKQEGIAVIKDEPKKTRYWRCLVCGEIVEGENPPEHCPVCKVGAEHFEEVKSEKTEFNSNAKETFVIIGGGIAGLSACEEIRKRNKVAEIEIISKEEVFCYSRPLLTKSLLGEFDGEKFFERQLDWYKENRIGLALGQSVEKIDLQGSRLFMENGEEKKYDKLIYATGAECGRLPIKGSDRDGIYYIRTLADANAVKDGVGEGINVTVIGGGILGLEAAWELKKGGCSVTVLERAPRLMMNQLDSKGSEVLKDAAEKSGVKVVCNAYIDRIDEKTVVLEDGTEHLADMVIISAGIKPNAQLGVESGLEGDRWIAVNEHMKTSQDNVFAAGDVASYNGVSIGIWPQAVAMGRIAGINAAGDKAEYEPVIPSNVFTGFNTEMYSIGDIGRNPSIDYKSVQVFDDKQGSYRKMYFVDNKFVGGILMGHIEDGPKMLKAYEEGHMIGEAVKIL